MNSLLKKTLRENRLLRRRVNRIGLTFIEMFMVREGQKSEVVDKLVREGFRRQTAARIVNAYHRDISSY